MKTTIKTLLILLSFATFISNKVDAKVCTLEYVSDSTHVNYLISWTTRGENTCEAECVCRKDIMEIKNGPRLTNDSAKCERVVSCK